MNDLIYHVVLTPDEDDGGFVVTFPDIPEAITQGNTLEECLEEGAGALEAAISMRIIDGMNIPLPSKNSLGNEVVALPLQLALKAALYITMRETGVNRNELARLLHVHKEEVIHILDPKHKTELSILEHALSALDKSVELHAH